MLGLKLNHVSKRGHWWFPNHYSGMDDRFAAGSISVGRWIWLNASGFSNINGLWFIEVWIAVCRCKPTDLWSVQYDGGGVVLLVNIQYNYSEKYFYHTRAPLNGDRMYTWFILSIHLSVHWSVSLSICLSILPSVCPSICRLGFLS